MKVLRLKRKAATTTPDVPLTPLQVKALSNALDILNHAEACEKALALAGGKSFVSWESRGLTYFGLTHYSEGSKSSQVELLLATEDETEANEYPLMGYRASGKTLVLATDALTIIQPEDLGAKAKHDVSSEARGSDGRWTTGNNVRGTGTHSRLTRTVNGDKWEAVIGKRDDGTFDFDISHTPKGKDDSSNKGSGRADTQAQAEAKAEAKMDELIKINEAIRRNRKAKSDDSSEDEDCPDCGKSKEDCDCDDEEDDSEDEDEDDAPDKKGKHDVSKEKRDATGKWTASGEEDDGAPTKLLKQDPKVRELLDKHKDRIRNEIDSIHDYNGRYPSVTKIMDDLLDSGAYQDGTMGMVYSKLMGKIEKQLERSSGSGASMQATEWVIEQFARLAKGTRGQV